MKKITLILLIAITCVFTAKAQPIDVLTGLNDPKRMVIAGNDMYFTSANSILKFDITDSDPTPEVIISGLVNPSGMAITGNDLYVAEFNGGRISKIDISLTDPVREDFVTGLNTPNFLLIDGDFLYYSDNNSNIVARFDLNVANPSSEVIATSAVNFNPTGLAIRDNILYMGQGNADRISSVDVTSGVTDPDFVVAGTQRPLGIRIMGGKLFIAEFIGNLVSEYTLDENPPVLTDIVTGLSSPRDIALSDTGTLYIIEGGADKIVKVEDVLHVSDTEAGNIVLFPNPASDVIHITGIKEPVPYTLYSVSGQEIRTGDLNPSGEIQVTDLKSGMYILVLEGISPVRFLKN
tara:strand:+ start:16312 stop:17358 length:1047 start_codon:yes stop_codon:yes gene_type:complete